MTAQPPAACPAHSSTNGLLALTSATGAPDPAAVYRDLRRQWGNIAKVELEPGVPAWLVMGYRELLIVTRQEQLFSRDGRNWRDLNEGKVSKHSGLLPLMGWRASVIGADGPEHRRLREPLDDGIAKLNQRRMRRQVETICAELIEGFAAHGRADLVNEYATIVPMLAIASLFGLDSGQGHELLRALIAVFGSSTDSQQGNRDFEAILLDTLRERQAHPTDDLTTAFMGHPNLRDESEVLQSMVLMISAGNETVTAWISHTLRLMLTDPRFAAQVRGGQLGIDDALDEALWREPPMSNTPARYALRDTELGGQYIRRGDVLILGIAAANDDPAAKDSGAEHGNRSHLAFSAGPHTCPARVPARLITRTAVKTALNLLPDVRLSAPAADIRWRPSPWSRVPASLDVEFSPTVRPL